jgi:hypothetical protein
MLRRVANWDDRFSQHKEVSEREWREGAATQFLRISTSAGRRRTDYFKRGSTSKRVEQNKYGAGSELGKVNGFCVYYMYRQALPTSKCR